MALNEDEALVEIGAFTDGTLYFQCSECKSADPDEIVYYTIRCGHLPCLMEVVNAHITQHLTMEKELHELESL